MSEACKRKCTNAKHLVCSTYKMYLKSKTKDRVNDMFEGNYPSQMNHFLCKAAQALEAWLARVLPKTGVNWWEECVLSNLTPFQRKGLDGNKRGGSMPLTWMFCCALRTKRGISCRRIRIFHPAFVRVFAIWRMSRIAGYIIMKRVTPKLHFSAIWKNCRASFADRVR